MPNQIICVPDSNGIIRVGCGEDTIEILVLQPGTIIPGFKETITTSTSEPVAGAKGPDKEFPKWSSGKGPFDKHRVFAAPFFLDPSLLPGGRLDIEDIVSRALAQNTDPAITNPTTIVVGTQRAINLHDISKLSSQMDRLIPGVSLALRFGMDDMDD